MLVVVIWELLVFVGCCYLRPVGVGESVVGLCILLCFVPGTSVFSWHSNTAGVHSSRAQ
jgi:hypothetical protein